MSFTRRRLAAFLRRDLAIALSYRIPFVLDGVSVLLQLSIAYFVGRSVHPGPGGDPALRGGYFAFAAVGVSALGVLQVGLVAFGQRVRQEQETGTLEMLMASPAPASLVLLGGGCYELAREAVIAVLSIVIAVVAFGLHLRLSPGLLAAAVAAFAGLLLLVSALGMAVVAFALVFQQAGTASTVLAAILGVASGVWFPTSVLPAPLDAVAAASPVTWGLEAMRDALIVGTVRPAPLLGVVGAAALAGPAALVMLRGAIRRARRDATLALY